MSARGNPAPEDIELVREAIGGSEDAYRVLVVRYQRPILSLIRRMVRAPTQAEDLAQEVFIKAFRALESFDQQRKFSSWLFKIAHNTAIGTIRISSQSWQIPKRRHPRPESSGGT